jgi:hypothetical protein
MTTTKPWAHMEETHGLTLLESELRDIMAVSADDFTALRIVSNNRLASLESNILKLKHELLRLRDVACPDDITNIDSVLSETSNP